MLQHLTSAGGSYSFSAANKTVSIVGVNNLMPEQVMYIFNVTQGVKIYAVEDGAPMGTWQGNTVTLAYDTTSHADTDRLAIMFDAPATLDVKSETFELDNVEQLLQKILGMLEIISDQL